MYVYYYSLFYLIFVPFAYIDGHVPLESLVLSAILNQIQMFVMKLEKLVLVLSSFVKCGYPNYQLSYQNNA